MPVKLSVDEQLNVLSDSRASAQKIMIDLTQAAADVVTGEISNDRLIMLLITASNEIKTQSLIAEFYTNAMIELHNQPVTVPQM